MFKGVAVFSAIASVLALSGCAPKTWSKPGATQSEFSQARYECMQQSQQQVSGAYVNKFGGSASSQVITNDGLFSGCMNAKGFYLGNHQQEAQAGGVAPVNPVKVATDVATEGFKATCEREDVKPLIEKSPCSANLINLEHMADTSKITPEQKAALSKFRSINAPITYEMHAAYRKHGGAMGADVVAVREKAQRLSEQNQLDLYEGKQTWGEFNKRRSAINKEQQEETAKVTRPK